MTDHIKKLMHDMYEECGNEFAQWLVEWLMTNESVVDANEVIHYIMKEDLF